LKFGNVSKPKFIVVVFIFHSLNDDYFLAVRDKCGTSDENVRHPQPCSKGKCL